jgi:hypothetical protein
VAGFSSNEEGVRVHIALEPTQDSRCYHAEKLETSKAQRDDMGKCFQSEWFPNLWDAMQLSNECKPFTLSTAGDIIMFTKASALSMSRIDTGHRDYEQVKIRNFDGSDDKDGRKLKCIYFEVHELTLFSPLLRRLEPSPIRV